MQLPPEAEPPSEIAAPGGAAGPNEPPHLHEQAFTEIMQLLRVRTRHDFRQYKRPTVLRRLARRMQVTGVPDLPAYRELLEAHPDETQALLQDMLISVTHFFRDREAFETLERQVLPDLLQRLGATPLRAWVVGCASGEEAYTVAMLLQEARAKVPLAPPFLLFATDIDNRALATARAGLYPESTSNGVEPARLRNFFMPEHGRYRVVKSLRERVLFAHHNVLHDPPFSRVDLILCRNLLIYLDARAQAAVLDTFRFSLQPGGVLFLGASESVDSAQEYFSVIDKKHRMHQLRADLPPMRPPALPNSRRGSQADARSPAPAGDRPVLTMAQVHERAREASAPPSVLIDAQHKILHVGENVARFLQMPGGAATQQLPDHTHPQLQLALRTALFKVRSASGSDVMQTASTEGELDTSRVRVTVRPVGPAAEEPKLLLVLFEDLGPAIETAHMQVVGTAAEQVVLELEADNRRLQQQLRVVIEQSETSTDEMMSTNEELQALNEEMRSVTEELETSREELQSTNEELTTVNAELASKVEEASRINEDLSNLINANDIATVFVDRDVRIKRYTPRAAELFNLIRSDVGRSLLHITHRLDYPQLADDAKTAFQAMRLVEREVPGEGGRLYMVRLLPHRTGEGDGDGDGAIMSFVDVTSLRAEQQAARHGAEQLRLAVESTRDFVIVALDEDGCVSAWNAGAERLFGWTQAEMKGATIERLYTEEDVVAGVLAHELSRAREDGRSEDERWYRRKDGSVFFCSGVTTRLAGGLGYAKIARDFTGSQQAMQARERELSDEQAGRRKAEAMMEAKEMFLAVMSHELKHPLNLIHLNADLLSRLPAIRQLPAAARAASVIQQTVAGQARIIDDLLDLSRARTGKLSLEPAPVDWSVAMQRIVDALRPEAEAHGLHLVFKRSPQPVVSLFDPVRADQVVWNLLSNALKFTPGGGSVRARVSVDGDQARLTVTDTGRGIEAAFLGRVFDMFSQEPGVRNGNEGMGIGLALVRELVQAHGGRVHVRSDGLGRGAEFSVWVPLHTGAPTAPPPALAPSVLHGLKVLVVDDSSDSVDALSLLLGLTGARVSGASGGAQALACIEGERQDLVISDVSMPGMSGHELMREVRRREQAQGLPPVLALAVSGYGRAQDQRDALAAGFDALVAKPAALEKIEQAVATLMAQRGNPG